ncbi:hypothetical protein OAN307_c36680 [Octadecabacter antarcticus 307]|uniref:Uncharacterized protein n=1 Tax=Octadecabacter antarcticus 307 TaxID=391626 RepID=M9RH19_9RHOB|nr:hypothetical protein OAN307_c36680 [Octadecabacter antarcticus 307]
MAWISVIVGWAAPSHRYCVSTAEQRMRQNGISVVRTRKHKATTDSNHKFNIAPNLLDRDFAADAPLSDCMQSPAGQWMPLNIGLEKPRRFRKQGGLNEHLGRQ